MRSFSFSQLSFSTHQIFTFLSPMSFETQTHEIEEKFGYLEYTGMDQNVGWLLNYQVNKLPEAMWNTLYFVKEDGSNFKINIPFYCSFLIETTDNHHVTEFLLKRYPETIYKIQERAKHNLTNFNHLNKEKTKYLKVLCKNENGMHELIRDIKDMIGSKKKKNAEIFVVEEETTDPFECIIAHYETDIPTDTQAANSLNVRCGLWYSVSQTGEEYCIKPEHEKVEYPALKIFAYDIETSKAPLMFPKADIDQIMMISIKTESAGYLIINQEWCSEVIESFSYSPKPEMYTDFVVYNEDNEKNLLIKFIEIIHQTKPHIMTTFNGAFFDYPFLEKRLEKMKLSLEDLTGMKKVGTYYTAPFMVHLDCFLWAQRDSYLPASSRGLKAATRAKLGYEPDEIDPEEMVRTLREEPQKMASYSVSDAVATYYLYMRFVHSHIFSLCSIIPLPPDKTLTKGTSTLCEALLISQAEEFDVLVPYAKRSEKITFHNGHVVENLTYVGGHVESLKAGVFRADFLHEFKFNEDTINLIRDNLDDLLEKYATLPGYQEAKEKLAEDLNNCKGKILEEGAIYHLDVGAMYPNIILTNKLQPVSIVNEETCIRCDYNNDDNVCKRKMNWISRAEYYPPTPQEVTNIVERLNNEPCYVYDTVENKKVERKVKYNDLPLKRKSILLKQRLSEYSTVVYKRSKFKEEVLQNSVVCQREVPFYVDTVKKFRDQRYKYKEEYKKASKAAEEKPTKENLDKASIFNSLQVAYKCVLNSFYGYVMSRGSRWWSIDMAAITCKVGGEIITKAKSFVNGIGIPLELDTDGIWAVIPSRFPSTAKIGSKSVSILNEALNFFVCKMFSNSQFQEKSSPAEDGSYRIRTENTIFFEIDGPYKTMVIPASIEENKLLKKRYIVFDFNDKIADLKGFELKRRGELKFIKKFQEDIIPKYCAGSSLKECYMAIAEIAKYWLNIIDTSGANLDDKTLFELFCESKSMSKDIGEYCNKKSNILNTAKKLADMFGDGVLQEKLKCEFIVSRYPESDSTADRVIPVVVFKSVERDFYLHKWLGKRESYEIRDLIDWDYYRRRYVAILQRMIIVPAFFQGVRGLFANIEDLKWTIEKKSEVFRVEKDIEDIKVNKEMFYTRNMEVKPEETNEPINTDFTEEPSETKKAKKSSDPKDYKKIGKYIRAMVSAWSEFYSRRRKSTKRAYKVEFDGTNVIYHNDRNSKHSELFMHKIYLEVNSMKYFSHLPTENLVLPSGEIKECLLMQMDTRELQNYKEDYFFDHFSIKNTYNDIDPVLQTIVDNNFDIGTFEYLTITSAIHQQAPVYFITASGEFRTYAKNTLLAGANSVKTFLRENTKRFKVAFANLCDTRSTDLVKNSSDLILMHLNNAVPETIGKIQTIEAIHRELHATMGDAIEILCSLNQLTGVPIQNINYATILDTFYFKKLASSQIILEPNTTNLYHAVRNEMVKPGYYDKFAIQIELCGSILFAILEYETFLCNRDFTGVKTREFVELRQFVKSVLYKSAEGNRGALFLVDKLSRWIKSDSVYVSAELRETIESLHQQYLVNLTEKLKEKEISVFCTTKETFFIDTNKADRSQADKFTAYLINEINQTEGYEMVSVNLIRSFDKIAFVSPEIYVYAKNETFYSSVSEYVLPEQILRVYFSSNEIDNYTIYDTITAMDVKSAKLLLRILSYKRDTHGLVSNCYKLMKISEFRRQKEVQFNLTVFCTHCNSENYMRRHCVKCLNELDKTAIEQESLKYLEHCWYQQVEGDKHCVLCGKIEERKLNEYCACGGKFEFTNYMDELSNLNEFVKTKAFNRRFEEVVGFFK